MSPLIWTIVLLLGAAATIYLSCELFVNGVEWIGRKLSVGERATATLLAAFGTALPESVVTFVAVAFGVTQAQKALGVGAALGGPLVLATIAYAVVGVALILSRQTLPRTTAIRAEFKQLSRDQGWFLVIFTAKLGLGLVAFAAKPWLGLLFLGAYGVYFAGQLRGGAEAAEHEEAPPPLTFAPRSSEPSMWRAVLQTALALAVIFAASRVFVAQLAALGPALGLGPQLLALLLSPIATELPEIMNAMIWIRQGKHRLALANISGSMMIQATVPTAFGLFGTPWMLDPPLIVSGVVTLVAVGTLFIAFRRGLISRRLLAAMGGLYGAFVIMLGPVAEWDRRWHSHNLGGSFHVNSAHPVACADNIVIECCGRNFRVFYHILASRSLRDCAQQNIDRHP